jgi:transcriptional regulator with XRE-family HTH domain
VCASCAWAARDLESVTPTWLWDSQPMRQALARLDPGAALAIFRAVSGLSQQDVADIVGWSQSTVSLIEKGQRDTLFDIRELLRFADMVEMPREALAPVLSGKPEANLPDDGLGELGGGAEEDVDRRGFGSFAAGAAAAIVLPQSTIPARVTDAHVRYLQACADSLWQRDQAVGGAAILKQALRHWQRARRMLDESDYSEAIGGELLRVASDLGACSGWLACDGGNVRLARWLYSEALLTASGSGRPEAAAQVLAQWSMLSSFAARMGGGHGLAREGLRLADQAADAARHVPMPRLHALIALRHANAASVLGDESTFMAAISRSRNELDRGVSPDDPKWIQFVDEFEIQGQQAIGHMNLGASETSVDIHHESLAAPNLPPRNRLCAQAQLSAALAAGGDLKSAVSEGMAVLTTLSSGVASIRALNELRPVRRAAKTTAAEEFCGRFDAVELTLPT